MAKQVVRRMLRIPVPDNKASIDGMLIDHLDALEEDSPHRMQEWVRTALRNQLERERLMLLNTDSLPKGEA